MKVSTGIFSFIIFACIWISTAFSATWDGGGGDGLASNLNNWTGDALPLYADMITFDATSVDCTWDLDGLYSVLTIGGGYTGTVTLTSTLILSVVNVPDTGQTTCYDSAGVQLETCVGTGQDGDYTGHPMSFTDNGDGTITDNITGLEWQKCSYGQSTLDCTGSATGSDWASAVTICIAVDLPGTGWRLPDDFELMSIADYGVSGPAINGTVFPSTESSYYWSSNTYSGGSTFGNTVHFYSGMLTSIQKSNTVYTRCVRGTPAANAKAFTDNGDGTIMDNVTGLFWQKCSYGQDSVSCSGPETQSNWDNAISDCEGLSLGGFTDWRLPNIKELRSIADSTLWPSINTTFFPNSHQGTWWSSTTQIYTATYAWGVSFGYGAGVSGFSKNSATYYVRCVRGQ